MADKDDEMGAGPSRPDLRKSSPDLSWLSSRPVCPYDPSCYRLNENHLQSKRHPFLEDKFQLFLANPTASFDEDVDRNGKILEQLRILKKVLPPAGVDTTTQGRNLPAAEQNVSSGALKGPCLDDAKIADNDLARRGREKPVAKAPAKEPHQKTRATISQASFIPTPQPARLLPQPDKAGTNISDCRRSTCVELQEDGDKSGKWTREPSLPGTGTHMGDGPPEVLEEKKTTKQDTSLGARPKEKRLTKVNGRSDLAEKRIELQDATKELSQGNGDTYDLEIPASINDVQQASIHNCDTGIVEKMSDEEGQCVLRSLDGFAISFDEVDVRNIGKKNVSINVGSLVRYKASRKNPGMAEVVYVNEESLVPVETSSSCSRSDSRQSNSEKSTDERMSRSSSSVSAEINVGQKVFQTVELKKAEKNMRPDLHGIITGLPSGKDFGFIEVKNLPAKYGMKNVFFHFGIVRNIGTRPYILSVGNKVGLRLNKKDEFIERPRAFLVFLDDNSLCSGAPRVSEESLKTKSGWNVVTATRVDSDKVYLEDKNGKKLFMHGDKLSRFALPLKMGDEVSVTSGNWKKNSVQKARIQRYAKRNLSEYTKYFAQLRNLSSSESHHALLETYSISAMWEHLGNVTFGSPSDQDEYTFSLLSVVVEMFRHGKQDIMTEVITTLLKTEMVRKVVDASVGVCMTEDVAWLKSARLSVLADFCKCCIVVAPHFAKSCSPMFSVLSREATPVVLMNLFDECLDKISMQSEKTDLGNWKTLRQIPSEDELVGGFISENKHLTKVRVSSPYSSAEEYMDTYFRLLRAESFHSIQKGIKDLLSGKLDHRDMHCYNKVYLAGMDISSSGISLAIHFTPSRKIPNWEKSNQLMFGNLLCISPSDRFEQVIWATVANRDSILLNKASIIYVDICDFNEMSHGEVISCLQNSGGRTFMVESPTYFHSVRPVLGALQKVDLSEYCLQDQIVKAIPSLRKPLYTQFTYEGSVPGGDDGDDGDAEHYGLLAAKKKFDSRANAASKRATEVAKEMDEAQLDAFKYALDNPLAVIQGPPGCGKTYVGVKLLEVLLEWQHEKPILVMTYKNHALDEFLKHASTLDNCSIGDIVRIGGRSKEPVLEECNLNRLMRLEKSSNAIWDQIQELRLVIDSLREKIYKLLEDVHQRSTMSEMDLLLLLSDEQLERLVSNCAWSKSGALCYKINSKDYALQPWVRNKLLPNIVGEFKSLSNFVDLWKRDALPPKHNFADHLQRLFLLALKSWLPDKSEMLKLQQLQQRFVAELTVDAAAAEDAGKEDNDEGDDLDEYDKDYIQELQESRQNAIGKIRQGESIAKNALLLKLDQPITANTYNLTDFPQTMHSSHSLTQVANLWSLNQIQRSQFIYSILLHSREELVTELTAQLQRLEDALKQTKTLESSRAVQAVNRMKVIGVTITGASIHHDLLQKVAPGIVLVEEAAEILEPSLVAALNPSVQHLILIGDHKQLPPQVDTYTLVKKFNFNTSMMERLIMTNYPFRALKTQNRMRPEFSKMLKDIYPELEDNVTRVAENKRPSCLGSSLFFWDHNFMEDSLGKGADVKDRSKRNLKEAQMVMSLVLFLLQNGYQPKQITVLSGYLGQQKVLRNLLRDLQGKYPHLFPSEKSDNFVQIQTIDNYQGDENDIIIISLVRANPSGKLGFLNSLNRRCVAQSRAKCGMYFVGHMQTFDMERTEGGKVFKSVWSHIIDKMGEQNCIGNKINLRCWKHREQSQLDVASSEEAFAVIDDPGRLCSKRCGDLFTCGIQEHACTKSCSPKHSHYQCNAVVKETYPKCGHPVTRKCFEDVNRIPCEARVDFVYEKCGEPGKRKCYVSERSLLCHHPCKMKMDCKLHNCPRKCGEAHSHIMCKATVKFNFSGCGHASEKLCHESEADLKCRELVSKPLPNCRHDVQDECWKPADAIECRHPCPKKMSCNVHACPQKCGAVHNHENCVERVDYHFSLCKHPSPMKKKCSENITWQCKYMVEGTPPCGHPNRKECCQPWTAFVCQFRPCSKTRKCGHACVNRCGEDCEKGNCMGCDEVFEAKMKKVRFQAKKKMQELKEQIEAGGESFTREELRKDGPTMAEYLQVEDKIVKYCQPMHNFNPVVVKIEKVTNSMLEMKFEGAMSTAFGDNIDMKFHGTSDEGVNGIVKTGFRLPGPPKFGQKPGMYGQGIYFATDSSKSAQEIYTKGSNKLLLCKVLLGKSKTVHRADNHLSLQRLRKERFDSVFAPRGTQGTQGVLNDECVVFDPAQALPVYVIHYRSSTQLPSLIMSNKSFEKIRIDPTRAFDVNNSSDYHYRIAESHFLRMMSLGATTGIRYDSCKIEYVELVVNTNLEQIFDRKKADFKNKNVPHHEVLAFHGTPPKNIDSILLKNLDPNIAFVNGRAHGNGCYFSEFPNVSLGYGEGKGLILFRTLPGKEYCGPNHLPQSNFHSKKVNPRDSQSYGDMLIIQDSAQFVPYFVYHLKK